VAKLGYRLNNGLVLSVNRRILSNQIWARGFELDSDIQEFLLFT